MKQIWYFKMVLLLGIFLYNSKAVKKYNENFVTVIEKFGNKNKGHLYKNIEKYKKEFTEKLKNSYEK